MHVIINSVAIINEAIIIVIIVIRVFIEIIFIIIIIIAENLHTGRIIIRVMTSL